MFDGIHHEEPVINVGLVAVARGWAKRHQSSLYQEVATEWVTRLCDALESARRDALLEAAEAVESGYLGPDSGRLPDGNDPPDAHCRNAYDEGIQSAAVRLREMAGEA